MNCRETDDLLSSHLDGRRTGPVRSYLEAHLQRCNRCRERVRFALNTAELLRREGPAEPSADLVARIMEGIAAAKPVRQSMVDRWNRVAIPAAFAAALAALVVGMAAPSTPEAPADPIAAITANRGIDLGRLLPH